MPPKTQPPALTAEELARTLSGQNPKALILVEGNGQLAEIQSVSTRSGGDVPEVRLRLSGAQLQGGRPIDDQPRAGEGAPQSQTVGQKLQDERSVNPSTGQKQNDPTGGENIKAQTPPAPGHGPSLKEGTKTPGGEPQNRS